MNEINLDCLMQPLRFCDMGDSKTCSSEEIFRRLKEQETLLLEAVSKESNTESSRKIERFHRNRAHVLHLHSLDKEKRKKLPMSQFFPYFDDFDMVLRSGLSGQTPLLNDLDLEKLTFIPTLIKSGGFADIYAIESKDGREYVLKLFHSGYKLPKDIRDEMKEKEGRVKQNVATNKAIFREELFTLPRYIPSGEENGWYILDYFPGEDVRSLIALGKTKSDRKLALNAIKFYSKVLEHLHAKGFIMGDQGWSNVLSDGERFKVCDLDFIVDAKDDSFAEHVHQFYAPREYFLKEPMNYESDLESFALMTYHILTGKTLIGSSTTAYFEQDMDARMNHKSFRVPNNFPKNLAQVIEPLIRYPRKDSMTASEFRRAVDLDLRF